jgi:hypothetical protein
MSDDHRLFPVPPPVSLWRRIASKLRETFPEIAAKQLALWSFAFVSFVAVWLWGWLVGGGLTRAVGAIPQGAVVAFPQPCKAYSGWNEYGDAAGRVILGENHDNRHSLQNRSAAFPNNSGGFEKVALKPENLPPHLHGGSTTGTAGKWWVNGATWGGA